MIHPSYSKNPAGNKVKVNSLLQVETAKHLKPEGNTCKNIFVHWRKKQQFFLI